MMLSRFTIGAIVCVLGSTNTQAQVMLWGELVCDLTVNDIRVSWPPSSLSHKECVAMRANLVKQDKTKADIICKCQIGGKT